MEEYTADKDLKNRLIIAGMAELNEHGVRDFSLRRVASEANVSCAAPYRHFKNKEELINEIIEYTLHGWLLMADAVVEAHGDDYKKTLIELCICECRFWIANRELNRTLSVTDNESAGSVSRFDEPLVCAIGRYCRANSFDEKDLELIKFTVLTVLYGVVSLVNISAYTADEAIAKISASLESLIK